MLMDGTIDVKLGILIDDGRKSNTPHMEMKKEVWSSGNYCNHLPTMREISLRIKTNKQTWKKKAARTEEKEDLIAFFILTLSR